MMYDFYECHTLSRVKEIVTEHLIAHFDEYTEWHGGNADQLVYEVTSFFADQKKFNSDVVDVVVQATADAFGLLIKIY